MAILGLNFQTNPASLNNYLVIWYNFFCHCHYKYLIFVSKWQKKIYFFLTCRTQHSLLNEKAKLADDNLVTLTETSNSRESLRSMNFLHKPTRAVFCTPDVFETKAVPYSR